MARLKIEQERREREQARALTEAEERRKREQAEAARRHKQHLKQSYIQQQQSSDLC